MVGWCVGARVRCLVVWLIVQGNTAVYLLYAYTRILSILANDVLADVDIDGKAAVATSLKIEHPKEVALCQHLARFAEVFNRAVDVSLPTHPLPSLLAATVGT